MRKITITLLVGIAVIIFLFESIGFVSNILPYYLYYNENHSTLTDNPDQMFNDTIKKHIDENPNLTFDETIEYVNSLNYSGKELEEAYLKTGDYLQAKAPNLPVDHEVKKVGDNYSINLLVNNYTWGVIQSAYALDVLCSSVPNDTSLLYFNTPEDALKFIQLNFSKEYTAEETCNDLYATIGEDIVTQYVTQNYYANGFLDIERMYNDYSKYSSLYDIVYPQLTS